MGKYFIMLQLSEILYWFKKLLSCTSHISTALESTASYSTLMIKVQRDEATRPS